MLLINESPDVPQDLMCLYVLALPGFIFRISLPVGR